MAKRKLKKAPNQQAYDKQLKRIKQFIRRAEKRGYQFTEHVIPKQPKRITKESIRKLEQLSPEKLYQKALYGGEASAGEILKGAEGIKLERKERARKAKETRKRNAKSAQGFWSGKVKSSGNQYYPDGGEIIYQTVLDEFITKLSQPTTERTSSGRKKTNAAYYASETARTTLYALTMRVKNEIGESALGWRLQANIDNVYELLTYILYGSDATLIASASNELASIIAGGNIPLSDLADIAYEEEQNEDWENPV